jgi:hypothetical protein
MDNVQNYSPLSYFTFFVAVVLNVIILLNLLIAIISETFAEIKETQKERGYQEKARVSANMIKLFGVPQPISDNTLLFIAKELQEGIKDEEDMLENLTKVQEDMQMQLNNLE